MIVQVYVNIGMKKLNMIIINLEWLMGKSNLHHENSTLGFGVLVYYFYSLQILNQFIFYYYTGMSSVCLKSYLIFHNHSSVFNNLQFFKGNLSQIVCVWGG
ncbi:hypothetical protein ABPG72_005307 [Tetrahymena utriculariae]